MIMLHGSLDMVRDRCSYFSFWAIFCHSPAPNSPKNQNFKKTKKQKTPGDIILHMCTKNYDYMLCGSWAMVRDGEMDGKSDIEVGAPPRTNQYFSNRVQLSLGWKKKNCKPNFLVQTLIYRSNIHYSKIYQKEDCKNNSSTLHLEVWTKYFRHRYSIKSLELPWIQRLLNPTNALWKCHKLYWLNLKNNSHQGLCLFR